MLVSLLPTQTTFSAIPIAVGVSLSLLLLLGTIAALLILVIYLKILRKGNRTADNTTHQRNDGSNFTMTDNAAHSATRNDSNNYIAVDKSYSYASEPTVAIVSSNTAYNSQRVNDNSSNNSDSGSDVQEGVKIEQNNAYGANADGEELYIACGGNQSLCYSYASNPTLAFLSSNAAYNAHNADRSGSGESPEINAERNIAYEGSCEAS